MINKIVCIILLSLASTSAVYSVENLKSKVEDNRVSQLVVTDSWARKSKTRRGNSAAYLKIQNVSKKDVVIIGANSDAAKRVELHQTFTDEKGISRMQEIEKLVIPAGETIAMKPGGLHVMLMGLRQKLKTDDIVVINLNIKDHNNEQNIMTVTAKVK